VNVVRENGKRSALLTVLKNGKTSTLDIVKGVKAMLPQVEAGPKNKAVKINPVESIVNWYGHLDFLRERCWNCRMWPEVGNVHDKVHFR
jgi:hypothetical protein